MEVADSYLISRHELKKYDISHLRLVSFFRYSERRWLWHNALGKARIIYVTGVILIKYKCKYGWTCFISGDKSCGWKKSVHIFISTIIKETGENANCVRNASLCLHCDTNLYHAQRQCRNEVKDEE